MKSARRFRRFLDLQYGCHVKVAGSVEVSEDGLVHAHGYLYVDGDLDALKLDMDFMAAADRAGLGDCWIRRIGSDDWFDYAGELEEYAEYEAWASYYGYPTKTLLDDELRGSFLELNRRGEKYGVGFQSDGFFRDGVDGEHLTERRAKQRAYQRSQKRRRTLEDQISISDTCAPAR